MSLSKKLVSVTGIILFFICLFPFLKDISADPGMPPQIFTPEKLPGTLGGPDDGGPAGPDGCPVCPPDPVCPDPCDPCVDCPAGEVDLGYGCGVPEPTPTSTPPIEECPVLKIEAKYVLSSTHGLTDFFISKPDTPSCLFDEVNKAIDLCKTHPVVRRAPLDLDDCVVGIYFMGTRFQNWDSQMLVKGPWDRVDTRDCGARGAHGRDQCADIFIDNSCNIVKDIDPQDISKACDAGSMSAILTPVSLIWEEGHDIEKDIRVSSFPLSPDLENRYYSWKASAKAPLVVYDPDKSGRITGAHQLFGEWTFGGKQSARNLEGISFDSHDSISPMPWKDGFEALSSLDRNYDGVISGSELSDLALWFDHGRDGVSQAGEVIPVSETGVVALYYSNATRNPLSKSLEIKTGYERVVNGVSKTGSSVDWYAEFGNTPGDVLNQHLLLGGLCSPDLANDSIQHLSDERKDENISKSSSPGYFNGIWKWTVHSDTPSGNAFEGILSFKNDQNGKVSGHSLSAASVKSESTGTDASSMIRIFPLRGSAATSDNNKSKIEFSVEDDKGSVTKSEATLSDDRKTLLGKSFTSIHGTGQTFSYEWNATKLSH